MKVDEEFKALIKPLEPSERAGLEASIVAEGCRDPIVVWDGIIVDGHNRYEICTANGVEFKTTPIEFADRREARIWIRNNQLHRRNLSDGWRAEYALQNKAELEAVAKETQGRRTDLLSNNDKKLPEHRTQQTIADQLDWSTGKVAQADYVRKTSPETWEKAKAGDLTIGKAYVTAKQEEKKREYKERLDFIASTPAVDPVGDYDVIVMDPPWPMQKITRDVRPNQVSLDYPVMQEEELRDLAIPAAEDCHMWVWTTHKFLPMALRLIDHWGFKYICTFVWHKPGGPQPYGLPQYNCEFALYAHRGNPQFVDTKAFFTAFEAPRGKHSEKPEEFYEVVRRVTGGRRIDMFNRRDIEGFDKWGNEA